MANYWIDVVSRSHIQRGVHGGFRFGYVRVPEVDFGVIQLAMAPITVHMICALAVGGQHLENVHSARGDHHPGFTRSDYER